jgi:fimbrial chaperone protein
MRRRAAFATVLAACCGTLLAPTLRAASLSVAPVRVELAAARATQALTLRNETDAPMLVQAEVREWTQAEGEERFATTRDVLVTPAVMTIPARGSQVVRVGLRGGPDPAVERSYRVFLQQVPTDASEPGAVRVSLRLSLPIFVAAQSGPTAPHLSWSLQPAGPDAFELRATNTGTGHFQIADLGVELASSGSIAAEGNARYVLPGARMSWRVELPTPVDARSRLSVRGHGPRGEFVAPVSISGS